MTGRSYKGWRGDEEPDKAWSDATVNTAIVCLCVMLAAIVYGLAYFLGRP